MPGCEVDEDDLEMDSNLHTLLTKSALSAPWVSSLADPRGDVMGDEAGDVISWMGRGGCWGVACEVGGASGLSDNIRA